MVEENLIDKLRAGEKIQCVKCHEGYYIPYNTTFDKAHFFQCSNSNCNSFCHWDPVINID